jgi:hypothetical protein
LIDPSKVLSKDADQASQTLLSESSYQGLLEKYFEDMELIHNQPMTKEEDDDDFTMEYYTPNKGSSLFCGSLHPLAQGNVSVLGVSSLQSIILSCFDWLVKFVLANHLTSTLLQSASGILSAPPWIIHIDSMSLPLPNVGTLYVIPTVFAQDAYSYKMNQSVFISG